MTMIIDGSLGTTFPDSSLQPAAASPYVLKNKIINGDMRIDQRNAGASVTPTNGQYTLDRYRAILTQASKFSVQQNAGSVTPPAGFNYYLGVTSLSAYSIVAGDLFQINHFIEGYNVADLAWGTANAKTVTLSFWVRSSLTGTFGGALMNSAGDRSYPYTYTISAANTWEQKTITITGDTSGTWLTTNGIGISVTFGLGAGSTYSGTAGSWQAAGYYTATGATSVVGTNGATFYITGVQLEVGSTATPFERRLYNQELANCQRYYWKWIPTTAYNMIGSGYCSSTTVAYATVTNPATMRSAPTLTSGGNFRVCSATCQTVTSISIASGGTLTSFVQANVASGLVTGNGAALGDNNDTTAYIGFSSEL